MTFNEIQNQTTKNIQEKASLIWEIATHLVGLYKPHEYGKVILPMTVLKRFDDILAPTKDAVVKKAEELANQGMVPAVMDSILTNISGYQFYNRSKFDFKRLLAEPDYIEENFDNYIHGFSENVQEILERFKFADEIKEMSKGNVLYVVLQEFNSEKGNMSLEKITSADMGYIFEELIRKFSESYGEQAGAHFTSRDIIYLMTELLVAPEKDEIEANGCSKTVYDMTMGTSQMLGCLEEKLKDINKDSNADCFGQEFNPETFAIAKSDMLIKGKNATRMMYGDTLSEDKFQGYEFDYIISNPPFGIDWKKEKDAVCAEKELGFEGRFGPGIPAISDGQLLFMLNGVKKLKEGSGRMAIIQNGSSLFTGDAGSGPSEIRKYLLTEDFVETIVRLPNDLFYNTGIATYIWLISKNKASERQGKVQLIDASKCFEKRRKNIGNKRVDLSEDCINLIMSAYNDFSEDTYTDNTLLVESKVFDAVEFGYNKITVERPTRLAYEFPEDDLHICITAFAGKKDWGWNGEEPFGVEDPEKVKAFIKDVSENFLGKKFLSRNSFEVALKPLVKKYEISKSGLSDLEMAISKIDPDAEIYVNPRTNKKVPDTNLRDTENVPMNEDIDAYFEREVLPYAPDAWIDKKKTKVGYEIPFTRYFYKYQKPESSEDIFKRISHNEKSIMDNLTLLFNEIPMSLKEYFLSPIKVHAYCSEGGLVDYENINNVPPIHFYRLSENHFYFNEETKEVILNIGYYFDKEVSCLLKRVFVPTEDNSFNLIRQIQKENAKLVLINEIVNQKNEFFEDVYSFFKKTDIEPGYRGYWK